MKVVYAARASGKTTTMIQWIAEKAGRVLIVHSNAEADRLREKHQNVAHLIVTWEEYRERRGQAWRLTPKEVGIDNADIILQGLIRDNLTIISVSK